MTRYVPARHYIFFGAALLALSAFSAWLGLTLTHGLLIPAGLFLLVSVVLLALAFRPAIRVYDAHIEIGKRVIPWQDIQRVDRTGWISPLVVKLTLFDDETMTIVYPGEVDCCKHVLRAIRQMATAAMIDGIPYRQYWGEMLGMGETRRLAQARPRVLRPEDEEEVERLYFLLKTVGHIDPRNSGEER
jgi:hypothetical protein